MTKCFDCKERDAEVVLIEYEQVLPLCEGCLHEHIHVEGDTNLDYWRIENLEVIFNEINKNLKYVWGKYSRLLNDYTKLKKGEGKVND